MKKFLALILATCSVLCAPRAQSLAELTSYITEGTYVLYVAGYQTSPYAVRLDNGGDTVLKADVKASRYVLEDAENVLGETVEFCGGQAELDALVDALDFDLVISGEIPGTYYGYAERLGTGVVVDGKHVNCQIVVHDGLITVGYPLIMGSYGLST